MIPAMIILELDIRTVDTISIKSYDHQKQKDAIILKNLTKVSSGLEKIY